VLVVKELTELYNWQMGCTYSSNFKTVVGTGNHIQVQQLLKYPILHNPAGASSLYQKINTKTNKKEIQKFHE
jgi:hypothetical protein